MTAKELLQSGYKTFNSDYAAATAIFLDAVRAAEAEDDRVTLVRALSMAARGYLIRNLRAEGLPYIERAATLARPEDSVAWSTYLGVKGRFEWQGGDNDAAKRTFMQWHGFAAEHGLIDAAIDAVHMIAIVGSPQEHIEWAHKGITVAENADKPAWLGPLWNNLGWTHFELQDYERALEALLKAREYHHAHSNDIAKLAADIFVARVLRVKGDRAAAREWLDKALIRATELYAKKQDGNTSERLGNCHEELGELDIVEGRPADGATRLREARRLYVEAGAEQWGPEEIKRVDERLAKLVSM